MSPPMERWLGLGMLFMLAVDLVVGVRLLLLARRTRELPELAFGSALVLLGAVGYPLATLARRIALDAPETGGPLLLAGIGAQNLACFAIYVANWRVFRPGSATARAAVVATAALFAFSWLGQLTTGTPDSGAFFLLGWTMRAGCFVWSAFESFRYHGLLRRRLALGLADPLVTDRFRLWGIANVAISFGFLVFITGRIAAPAGGQLPIVTALTSLVGVVGGATIWLAFVPPRSYVRRIRAIASA